MRRFASIITVALLLAVPALILADVALAQTVVVADEPSSPWQAIWKEIGAAVWPTLGLLVMGLITWLATWVREQFKWSVSDDMKNMLHSAVMSGILFGLKRIGWDPTQTLTKTQIDEVAASAVIYAKASSPEATALADDTTLTKMAEGKVMGVVTGIIVPAVPASAAPAAAPAS